MSPEKRREISSMGGRAVPPEKRPFAADPTLAAAAGKIGGGSAKRKRVKKETPDAG
jgi:general stress protein YciG